MMKTTTATTTATTTKPNNSKTRELRLKSATSSTGSVMSNGSNGSSLNNGRKLAGGTSNGSVASSSKATHTSFSINHGDRILPSKGSGAVPMKEIVVITTNSPPWKETFDYLSDQAFNIAGFLYLSCMAAMAWYFIHTSTDIDFMDELLSSIRLMLTHYYGIPFVGTLVFMVVLRFIVNRWVYQHVLNTIYKGKNEKYTAHYCEWFCDAVKNTVLFSLGFYVAYDSDWMPRPTQGTLWWIPRQGGTIFDFNGEIVPTCALALEVIGHLEVTVDFVSLLTLCYDAAMEYFENRHTIHHGEDGDKKVATTTTSFAEDFVHHSGVVFGALFLYITAKDNCNAIAIIVLLGQFNDMCEFSALALGLCKNWFLERVVAPVLCVFWAVSLIYVWPAALIPIFLESIPIEHSFDQSLVLSLTIYQIGSLFISVLFWAMHMFWLYKGIMFLYRYHTGVTYQRKMMKKTGQAVETAAPLYGRTACIATGVFPATKEHDHED